MMTPVPVTFCITDLDPGGAERAMVQIVLRMPREVWAPNVICLSGPGELVTALEQAKVPVACLGARKASDVWILPRLIRQLRQTKPQILQTFLFHANILGRLAGRWTGIPHILSGIRVAEKRSAWPLRIDRWTQCCVEQNICVSEGVAQFSHRQGGISRDKLIVIPNGVDAQKFATAEPADLSPFGVPPGIRPFICIGRLDEQKGHRYLFEAIARIDPADPDLHLLVVGTGPLEKNLREWVEQRGLKEHIHFTGWSDQVPGLLRASSVFVLASLWEGMPNVVLEAMAAGLPIIATAVEGVGELVVPERNGMIVPPRNSGALADALTWFRAHPEAAAKMGQESQHIVKKEFTTEAMAIRHVQFYRRILDTSR
ncbi:MAG: glycosyltransferase [Planctomycetaceae bacterium]